MRATPFERPYWMVLRFTLGSYEGQVTDQVMIGEFWDRAAADAECARLASFTDDPDVVYEVIEMLAHGVYPHG